MHRYLYLHGFASGPQSRKAQFLRTQFAGVGRSLLIPDFNQDDFTHLTLTRQLQQVEALLSAEPTVLIGASFGGLTAAWLADRHPQVEQLILLAPAFEFLHHWLPRLGPAQLAQWQRDRDLAVYHHGANRPIPLDYHFVEDLQRYDDRQIQRAVPTLILHGQRDEVIPVDASRRFRDPRPWVQLVEVDSDHGLLDQQAEIWRSLRSICDF